MGILPDVRVLAGPADTTSATDSTDRDEVIRQTLRGYNLLQEAQGGATAALAQHFDDVFVLTPRGYRTRLNEASRWMLITWETAGR